MLEFYKVSFDTDDDDFCLTFCNPSDSCSPDDECGPDDECNPD